MPGGDSEIGVVCGAALLLVFTFSPEDDCESVAERLLTFAGEGRVGAGRIIVLLDESDVVGGTVTLMFASRGGFFLKSMMIIVMAHSAAMSIKMIARGVI